jgi:hypothetical protein
MPINDLHIYAFYAIATGLLLAEIGLLFALRSATKEIRGMRGDIPKIAAAAAALWLLKSGAEHYTKREEK